MFQNPTPYPIDKSTSELIRAMRFPLIVMVVIVHILGKNREAVLGWSSIGWDAYHLFTETFSHNVCLVANPCFFLISGFLFCATWSEIGDKLRRRVRSLLVPFLLWNSIAILAHLSIFYGLSLFHIPVHDDGMDIVRKGPLYWFFIGPADYPLWFIRDLLIVTVLSPVFHQIIARFPIPFLILGTVLYLAPIHYTIPSITAFFFFYAGYAARMYHVDLIHFCKKFCLSAFFVSIVTLGFALYYNTAAPSFHEYLLRLYFPFGVIIIICTASTALRSQRISDCLMKLSPSVFFIYALHTIYVLPWTKGRLLCLFGNGLLASWMVYLCTPAIVLLVCLSLYQILKKWTPNLLGLLCGNRI